ncbi:unnamed protein product [Linum tenue]|uniref:SOSEKI DIX-like domain-containing protein n=1 Tax=Linum tenue TaxID=586396 RepID=A0AAV0MZR9_9ROSI|nr:unnamed protein product [Linum tenue]
MSVISSRGSNAAELRLPRKWTDREATPERIRVWGHNRSTSNTATVENVDIIKAGNTCAEKENKKKAPVVYYLSRNGQLEHPHFMEVPLSSPDGLYLRDVLDRLNLLRGKGMAALYSWSCKRSYKSGFVWHDLAEGDFIYPAHGSEYVLKGSELLEPAPLADSTDSFRSVKIPAEIQSHKSSSSSASPPSSDELNPRPAIARRRNQSWSSIDLSEYKVYRAEPFSQSSRRLAADAATQTEDKRRWMRPVKLAEEEEEEEIVRDRREVGGGSREEIEIEISPPPSDSSPETLETLMKADRRLILLGGRRSGGGAVDSNPTAEDGGKVKASTVLMQLFACGSMSFRDCGAAAVKEQGLSLIGQRYKGRLPRGAGDHVAGASREFRSPPPGVRLEDKEYFSGSLIETKKKEEIPAALKRCNSYNADRMSQLQLGEQEVEGRAGGDGATTKCIPRKLPKAGPAASRKEKEKISHQDDVSNSSEGGGGGGSKRFEPTTIRQVEETRKDGSK